jgi:hypothetical protein
VCSPVSQQQQGIWAFRIGPPLRQPLSAGDEHRATRSLAQDGDAGSVCAAVRSSSAVHLSEPLVTGASRSGRALVVLRGHGGEHTPQIIGEARQPLVRRRMDDVQIDGPVAMPIRLRKRAG